MFNESENDFLVNYLIFTEKLYSKNIINAFYEINRSDFVTADAKEFAFNDMPLSIGYSQTISQPQVVAFMLELLDVKVGQNVLDIGSGSGYTTALLSKIAGSSGFVTGLERLAELVEFGCSNLNKYDIKNVKIIQADECLGIKEKTFDRILVSAAASTIPDELINQLKNKGKLVIPINNSIFLIEKRENNLIKSEYKGFVFVPLIYK